MITFFGITLLNFKAKIELAEGINRTAKAFEKQLSKIP